MPLYTLRGVEVDFPYDAYPSQLTYMEKVIQALQEGLHALLESPTGTGKTLCLLCAALAWRESEMLKNKEQVSNAALQGQQTSWAQSMKAGMAELQEQEPWRLPRIIYSSRTHSQLAQVIGELKNTKYRCKLKSTLDFSGPFPGSRRFGQMLKNVGGQTRRMRTESFCKHNPDINAEPMDIEELVKLGGRTGPCPFFLARDMTKTAEIVFMPYNYLTDPTTRTGIPMDWTGSIIIFDEAHNLSDTCTEVGSWDIPAVVLATCQKEALEAMEIADRQRFSEEKDVRILFAYQPLEAVEKQNI